jgi:hypothetical protein
MRPHRAQYALWTSDARYCVVEAGRRSGKSELAKRRGVDAAMTHHARSSFPDGHYKFGAPTRDQAKFIYWDDLNRLVPDWAVRGVSKVDLTIDLINGARIYVVGLDAVKRIEGQPCDWFFGDEAQEWKRQIWDVTIFPALQDREGRAWVYGVPRPGAEFDELAKRAKSGKAGWEYFYWTSDDVLSAESLAAAAETMDPLLYAQEMQAQRVELRGRAYYTFDRQMHGRESIPYDPDATLLFCFDFNVEPGIAVVAQQHRFRWSQDQRTDRPEVADEILAFIGEVWIPTNSRTEHVVRKLIADWGAHRGLIVCYGDQTGGARKTSQGVEGSDWAIIRSMLRDHFGSRVSVRMRPKNPPERERVNALCALFRNAHGKVGALIDPKCKWLLEDCGGTMLLEGGSGEIDKDRDPMRTHMTDAIGYLAEYEHGLRKVVVVEDGL